MHHKIKAYVYFKLRGDHSKDHLEKKEEITSNIIERYDELYEETNDETAISFEDMKTMIKETMKETILIPIEGE